MEMNGFILQLDMDDKDKTNKKKEQNMIEQMSQQWRNNNGFVIYHVFCFF